MKLIDLSVELIHGNPSEAELARPNIEYVLHKDAVEGMLSMFEGVTADDLPGGNAWAYETVTLQTHSGTHIDAPYHYGAFTVDGKPTSKISEIPLDWFFHDGVKLDFSRYPEDKVLMPDDYRRELDRISYQLKPFDIVLVQTGAAQYWKESEYLLKGAGTGRAATLWLIGQGIHVMGTDAWSWDRPLSLTAKEFNQTRDKSLIWEGHYAGLEKPYCHIEKLANLDQLPSHGFKVACFPVKIDNASAGWARVVGILEEVDNLNW